MILSLAFSQDGNALAVGMWNGFVRVYTRTEGSWKVGMEWRLDWNVWSLAFTPDGNHLVSGTGAGSLYKVELSSGSVPERLTNVEAHTKGEICSLVFADETTLLVGQNDTSVSDGKRGYGRLAIISWPDGKLLREMNDFWGGVNSIIPLDEGRRLLVPKNRTEGLVEPDRFYPSLLDFGDVNLGRGSRPALEGAPDWLIT